MTLEKMQQRKLFDSVTDTNLPGFLLPRDLDLNWNSCQKVNICFPFNAEYLDIAQGGDNLEKSLKSPSH
jgi:hypothetical protein